MPALFLLALLAHPNSLSVSDLVVEGREVRATHTFQVLSLLEVIEGLDADEDGTVTRAEAERRGAEIFGYVFEHYRLRTGTSAEGAGGEVLVPEPLDLRHVDQLPGIGFRAGAVVLEVRYLADRPVVDLAVECTTFWTTSPDHIDICAVHFSERQVERFTVSAETPDARVVHDDRGVSEVYFDVGWRHLLKSWEAPAALVLLLLGVTRRPARRRIATVFVGACPAGVLVAAQLPASFLAPRLWSAAAALGVAYLATDLLVFRAGRARWTQALLLGALQGAAACTVFARALAREPDPWGGRFGLAAGAAAGLFLTALAASLVLRLFARQGDEEPPPALGAFVRGLVLAGGVAGLAAFWTRL